MSIIKHIVILKTGFHFSFMHAKPMDWEHVRAIIHDNTVEVAQARWDGTNYEMLCDENALGKNNTQLNQKQRWLIGLIGTGIIKKYQKMLVVKLI